MLDALSAGPLDKLRALLMCIDMSSSGGGELSSWSAIILLVQTLSRMLAFCHRLQPLLRQSVRTYAVRKYTPEHEWVSVSNGIGTFGISDYAQKALGDVVYIEVPTVGDSVAKKDQIGAVESVKAASDIYAPISGTITEVNANLEGEPSLINSSPFEKGWIARIKLSSEPELKGLLSEEEYAKHIDG